MSGGGMSGSRFSIESKVYGLKTCCSACAKHVFLARGGKISQILTNFIHCTNVTFTAINFKLYQKPRYGFMFALDIVAMAPSCTISEIKRDIGRKSRFFTPCIRRPV